MSPRKVWGDTHGAGLRQRCIKSAELVQRMLGLTDDSLRRCRDTERDDSKSEG